MLSETRIEVPTPHDPYDVFVSYARADDANGWVTRFVAALVEEHQRFHGTTESGVPARKLNIFFDKDSIRSGKDWEHTLTDGVANAQLFLAFISPNYFASKWCRREWGAWIDHEIAIHILTDGIKPIYLVEIPGFENEDDFAKLTARVAEFGGLPPPPPPDFAAVLRQARRRHLLKDFVRPFREAGLDALFRDDLRVILDQLARDIDHQATLLAQAKASPNTVPAYNAMFTGRVDELLNLRRDLMKDDRTGVIYGLHGLGGMGKTELAFTYAHAFASAYLGGRFLIRCDNKTSLREAILGQDDFLAQFKGRIPPGDRATQGDLFAAIQTCLRQDVRERGHVLLVLDNVTNLGLLARHETDVLTCVGPELHLLATTRLAPPASGARNWLCVDRLPDDDAMVLLEKHRPCENDDDRKAAAHIVTYLGGFTLTIELVAKWLQEHEAGTTYGRLAANMSLDSLNVIAEDTAVVLRYLNDQRRLDVVLGPMLDSLTPAARHTLEYAAFLHPDLVPLPWLHDLVAADYPEMAQSGALLDLWLETWSHLERVGLLRRTEAGAPVRLMRTHRMIQELLRKTCQAAIRGRIVALALDRANAIGEQDIWVLEPLLALAEMWKTEGNPFSEELKNRLRTALKSLPGVFLAIRQSGASSDYLTRLGTWVVSVYGMTMPQLMSTIEQAPLAEEIAGTLPETIAGLRLELDKAIWMNGDDHPAVALAKLNLASKLRSRDDLAEAETLCRSALAIDEEAYGPDHPACARDCNAFAQILLVTNRMQEAEALMLRAVAIDERALGPDHPDYAVHLNNLAGLLQTKNRLMEAEPLYRRVLAIWGKTLGPDHPDFMTALNNLALLLTMANRKDEAEALFRRAVPITENGPEAAAPGASEFEQAECQVPPQDVRETLPTAYDFDLFISYAHQPDEPPAAFLTSVDDTVHAGHAARLAFAAFVQRLKTALETDFQRHFQRPLKIFFDREDIQDFDHWQVRMLRALRSSRFFLALLTRNYLKSDSCRWQWEEWCRHEVEVGHVGQSAASVWFIRPEDLDTPEDAARLALWKGDLLQRFHVRLDSWREGDTPGLLDEVVRAELDQLTEHIAQRLRLLVTERVREGNLPWPDVHFVGRDLELAQLRAALVDAPETSPVSLHGVGGMGKTALALAFAHREADAFPGGTWKFNCAGRSELQDVLLDLVPELDLSNQLTEEQIRDPGKVLQRMLQEMRPRGTTLFILDNVDQAKLLAPAQLDFLQGEAWARLLCTTRLAADEFTAQVAKVRPLGLDRLPEDQAMDLMRGYQPEGRFAKPEFEYAAREIVRLLDGMPLAVETAAVCLGNADARVLPPSQRHNEVDPVGYLETLREELRTGGLDGISSQLREFAATVRPTLRRLDEATRTVLQIASLLGPEAVALPWLRAIAGQRHTELAQDDRWIGIVQTLLGMRLIVSKDDPNLVTVHKLLRSVLKQELNEDREGLEWAIRRHVQVRLEALENTTRWQDAKWEIEALEALAFIWAEEQHPDAGLLCHQAGNFWYRLADWKRAESLLRCALAIRERNLGPDDVGVADSLTSLALLLQATSQFSESEAMLRHALSIQESILGPDHPTVGATVDNLANLLMATNRHAEAEPLQRRALAIHERTQVREDPGLATSLTNLATLLQTSNRMQEAEPLLRKAIAILERNLGPDHPAIATSLNNLATLLWQTNRLAEAESVVRRALAISEASYGSNHPQVATALNSLAQLLHATNRPEEAEPLMRRALAIREASYGSDHPDVANSLNNLAGLILATHRPQEAELLFRRALSIDEACYGGDHPLVASLLGNLARLMQATQRLEEAEPLMRRMVGIFLNFTHATGHPHTRLQEAVKNYAGLLGAMGHSQEHIRATLREMAPELFPDQEA